MKFKFPYKDGYNPRDLIRRCGYGELAGDAEHQTSYARRMGSGIYPRFHIYLSEAQDFFEVNLHLDQKKPSYSGFHAHGGEYDGLVVEEEARRITAKIAEIYGVKV